jgi:hypothetical protein
MVDVSKKTCPSENVPDNFMYYQAQEPTPPGLGLGVVPPPPSRTPFSNQDASFLVACASNRPQYVRSSDLVVLVRGYLPRTPGGLDDAPFVGDLLVSASGEGLVLCCVTHFYGGCDGSYKQVKPT